MSIIVHRFCWNLAFNPLWSASITKLWPRHECRHNSIEQRRKLSRLLESPYFGRIDVASRAHGDTARVMPIYIGVHSFSEVESQEQLIHDWRAPISSMFYDFELGEAYYDAPEGRIDCEISLKRQYKIEKQAKQKKHDHGV